MPVYQSVVGRVVLAFSLLFVLARLMGKKQIAQLTFFDFITAIAVGDIGAGLMVDPGRPVGPFIAGLATWLGLSMGVDVFMLKWRRVGKVLEGEPTVVVHRGKILEDKLAGLLLRVDDLMSMLRAQGHFNPNDVEYAVLEPNGELSVLPRSSKRPLQPGDVGLTPTDTGMSAEVIVEGKVFTRNLQRFGRDEAWLRQQLAAHGIQDLREVFYSSINERGELYIDQYKDHIRVAIDISDYPGPS